MIYEQFSQAELDAAHQHYKFLCAAFPDKAFVIHASADGWVVRERANPKWNGSYLLWRKRFLKEVKLT
jgi:hypothetical protein